MLEAPEAAVIARQLNETITGKRVTVVFAAHTPHKFTFFYGDPALYEGRLAGRIAGRANACGGLVEINFEDTILLVGDGANLTFHPPGARLPSKHQLLVGFDDESCITVSVRMYGAVMCFTAGEFEGNYSPYYAAARNKPQVLSDAFTREYFMGIIGAPGMQKKSAKAALATEQSIPGLGNGVLQDILYNARIHPKTKVADIPPEKIGTIYNSTVTTLGEMLSKGGRNSEADLFGQYGRYVPWLSKDTEGEACTRCGNMILKENYMGGSIYYCSGCQVPPDGHK